MVTTTSIAANTSKGKIHVECHRRRLKDGMWNIFIQVLLVIARLMWVIWNLLTLPAYILIQRPWKKRAEVKTGAAWHETSKNDQFISYSQETRTDNKVYNELILKNDVDTVHKVWTTAVSMYQDRLCLGTREVIGEAEEKQDNGKVFKKLVLGQYQWTDYQQAHAISTNFGAGLVSLGQQAKHPIAIYSETRSEWILAALGAFSQNIVVSTLYTNLGEDAIAHGINETEVSLVITSHSLLPKFRKVLESCPLVKTVIVIGDPLSSTDISNMKDGVEVIMFDSVLDLGKDNPTPTNPPCGDDLAIIMYTSGSTGIPKGVMISHQNLVATSTTILFLHKFNNMTDVYIAYLPLAHVLELLSEVTMLLLGVPIGYSSPTTMTDLSTAIRKGDKGDASLLRPTIMCTVPLILDRIYKNLTDGVARKGDLFRRLFEFCYNYKLWWSEWGLDTSLLDLVLFSKLRKILGGRVDLMIVGGAPLSPSTQQFVRTCLNARLVQGYTMTETTCAGTCQVPGELSVGNVGGPMAGMEVRLVDWEEGNYKITDKPLPRGELVLGGAPVTKGYYKNKEKTEEDFFTENGKQFFRSGDIGELRPDGTFRLIDRKKDLIKLQHGEYVSLGKVESQMKTHPLVDNICVFARSQHFNTVAVLVPVQSALEQLIEEELGESEKSYEVLCEDVRVRDAVLAKLVEHGIRHGLEKFEIPTKIKLCPDLWLPESGLVTAAFKLKRKAIHVAFSSSINEMYAGSK